MNRCPVCDGLLTIIGSRARTRRTPEGIRHILIIRRLRCLHCRHIHHELPDCLVPFKRYDAEALASLARRVDALRPTVLGGVSGTGQRDGTGRSPSVSVGTPRQGSLDPAPRPRDGYASLSTGW